MPPHRKPKHKSAGASSHSAQIGPIFPPYEPPQLRATNEPTVFLEVVNGEEIDHQAQHDLRGVRQILDPLDDIVIGDHELGTQMYRAFTTFHRQCVQPLEMQVREQGQYHCEYMEGVKSYFNTRDIEATEQVPDLEETLNKLQQGVKKAMSEISKLRESMLVSHRIVQNMHVVPRLSAAQKLSQHDKRQAHIKRGTSVDSDRSQASRNSQTSRADGLTDDDLKVEMNKPVAELKRRATSEPPNRGGIRLFDE